MVGWIYITASQEPAIAGVVLVTATARVQTQADAAWQSI